MSPNVAPAEPIAILVAEDNKFDRMILTEAFRELGLNVTLTFVVHGEELLDYLRRSNAYAAEGATMPTAMVLMDLNMPRMNGNDALREIRADPALRALPVIIFSTADSPKIVAQAYANGANAFMTKPGRFEDLVDLLRKFGTFWVGGARLPSLHSSL